MKKKKVLGVVKFIGCVAIIGIVIKVGMDFSNKPQNKEYLIEDMYDVAEYEDWLKDQPSDINGMSKYDKYQMGLSTDDGADSDLDGLTDKEEIEIYGSDPTKTSTSGDLYSDGYKVKNGMDLNTFYEYKNDIALTGNSCPEQVLLEPAKAFDFNAIIADYTDIGMYGLADKDVLKIYYVAYYSGQVTIDLAQADPTLSPDDINIYVNTFNGGDAVAVKFTSNGSKVTLSETYNTSRYVIYIVKEEPGKKNKTASLTCGAVDQNGEIESGYGVLYGWFTNLKIKYVETENEALNEATKQHLIDAANQILRERKSSITEADIIATTEKDVEKTINFSKKLPEIKYPFPLISEYNGTVEDLYSYGGVYTYYIYDEDVFTSNYASGGTSPSSEGIKYASFVDGFSPFVDTLPFPNFGNEISEGGVCAGFSQITSELFNNGTLSLPSATFEYKGKVYSYDITADEENATLLDKGLSDYKDANFTKKHTGLFSGLLDKDLNNAEENFSTMIGYYWRLSNDIYNWKEYAKGAAGRDGDNDDWLIASSYDGTVVRSLLSELDNNRICNASFVVMDRDTKNYEGSGHRINIYGYQKYDTNNAQLDGYLFYVYDNNYPGIVGTLNCVIHKWLESDFEVLDYYLDIPGASYYATSDCQSLTNVGWVNMFVVTTSDFTVLPN